MSIEIIELRSCEDFLAQQHEWNRLLARSRFDTPFLRHEWLSTWWKHFSPEGRLSVLIAREAGRFILALPLVETANRFGPLRLTVLRSMTNTHSFRFHLLLEEGREDVLTDMWSYLRGRPGWDLVMLSDVPLDVGLHEPLLETVRGSGGRAGIWHAFQSGYIVPDGPWKNHEAKVSKSVRKQLRKQRNRLSRQGEVRLEVLREPDEIAAALPEAFDIERRSWKGAKGSAIACDPARVGFYTDFAELAAHQGWMRLAFLRVGDTRVAFDYVVQYNRRLHTIKIGYDAENFRKFSVGRLLTMDLLIRCFEEGLDEYDFIGPLTPADADWKPKVREIAWIFLYRKTLVGRLHFRIKFSLIPLAKRILQRLGRWKR